VLPLDLQALSIPADCLPFDLHVLILRPGVRLLFDLRALTRRLAFPKKVKNQICRLPNDQNGFRKGYNAFVTESCAVTCRAARIRTERRHFIDVFLLKSIFRKCRFQSDLRLFAK
jgi:hypothetical protein